jgi:hypothetical protein
LIAYIDDATSRIMHAAFVASESTLDYLREKTHNLTVQYDKILSLIEANEVTRPLARQRVTMANP